MPYEVTYDGVSSTTIPEFICHSVKRRMVGSRRHKLEEVPGLEGAWVLPEAPGMKQIEIEASVLAASYPVARRTAVRNVAKWIDRPTPRKLIISDDPTRYAMALLSDGPEPEEWRERATFTMVFDAQPYDYDLLVSTLTVNRVTADGTMVIEVGGDVYTEPILVYHGNGTTPNTMRIELNGRYISFGNTFLTGDRTFNSINKLISVGTNIDTDLQGVYDLDDVQMTHAAGLFPYLLPGTNTISVFNGSPAGWSLTAYWRNRYR